MGRIEKIVAALMLCALSLSAQGAGRNALTADTSFYASAAGDDASDCSQATPCRTAARAVRRICADTDVRGHMPTLQLTDGHFEETVTVAGYCELFIRGNPANPRAVSIGGLQVRDYAVVLFYDAATPWILAAQNAIIDAANFVLVSGDRPTAYQITVDDNSKFNAGGYSIDANAGGHLYVGHASRFTQGGGVTVTLASWLSLGTFYRSQWGGMIDLGPGITFVNRDQTTAIPADAQNRGMIIRGGNILPGSKYWPPLIGDGLLL